MAASGRPSLANGIPSASSKANASSSLWAVVVMDRVLLATATAPGTLHSVSLWAYSPWREMTVHAGLREVPLKSSEKIVPALLGVVTRAGVDWSLGLTGEAGYLLALIGGLLIGNVLPRAGAWFKEAARPELFIKTGIVIYGAVLGAKAAED